MKKSSEQIHYNMSKIHCKDTKIEMMLRKELWSRELHYRKNVKNIYGKPDIAFIGKRVAVFCDSEFWHGYDWKNQKKKLKTNKKFWISKIERNMERDREVDKMLKKEGWTVIRFWGKEIEKDVSGCADRIECILNRI